jgi:hypothetical protein
VYGSGIRRNGTGRFRLYDQFLCSVGEKERNQLVPQNGIFLTDAERTDPAKSAGRGGMAQCLPLINQV